MDRNYFDQLARELFKQKQLMDHLEAENRELRKLLAGLRAGQGSFSLRDSPSSHDHLAGTR